MRQALLSVSGVAVGAIVRFVVCVLCAALTISLQTSRCHATTINLPLNGLVEVLGDIPSPIAITFAVTANSILPTPPPPYVDVGFGTQNGAWEYQILLFQLVGGQFSKPQGCTSSVCGTLDAFEGCGGGIGCGFDPRLPGHIGVGPNGTVTIEVSDDSRLFGFISNVVTNIPFNLQFSAEIPDGASVGVLQFRFDVPQQTPLPSTFALFASGVGALALFLKRGRKK